MAKIFYNIMAAYSKSLEDYFRIPILIKPITNISSQGQSQLEQTLYYKYHSLPIDQRYTRTQNNPNTDILTHREYCLQKLYFTHEEISTDWPEFEVIYKIKYAIGIIDESVDEKTIGDVLAKIKHDNSIKLIGILNMGSETYENIIVKQNIVKYPDLKQEEFRHFIEPWLYNCLAYIESDLCNIIAEAKREDDTNRTIVFNRMEDKFDPKVMKRKKKYRCMKLCGDYYLMLQLYKEAYAYFNEAEEQLRKLDDYLWVLGTIQGKLACTAVCQSLNFSNHEQYIEHLIADSYAMAKKTKIIHFQCQNYLKIIRLYVSQPQKMQDLLRTFMSTFGKSLHQDQQFLLYTILGQLYQQCGMLRKKNYYYFLASLIHLNKKEQLSEVLLLSIQKQKQIKQFPFLYKEILKRIISCSDSSHSNSQYFLEILSKCGNHLSQKEIEETLAELNFSHHPQLHLQQIDFIHLKEFEIVESAIKPKNNRIGSRKEGVVKTGPGFFMSWKKEEHLLFEENQEIVFKGAIYNNILFPIRLKISFQVQQTEQPSKVLATPELFCYIEPNNLHKFQSKVRLRGASQQIWMIDKVEVSVWNFKTNVPIQKPIKFQIYQKQPQINLSVDEQIQCQQSSDLYIEAALKTTTMSIPFCLIKFSISVYYTVDVGFQENEIILSQEDHFRGIDFGKLRNLKIVESRNRNEVLVSSEGGCLTIQLKKLKVHRRHVGRMQFNLEYIRTLNTKYQTSKHYVSKCLFYQDFKCQIESISTPTIQKIYKNPLHNSKIIEKHFTVRLKTTKLNNSKSTTSYKVYHEGKEYLFREDNTLTLTFVRQKIKEEIKNDEPVLKQLVLWENVFNPLEKGQIQIGIPYHPLMKQCQREVLMNISTVEDNQHHCKKIIKYSICSYSPEKLSHQITLNPLEVEVDRLWVMVGKNKVETDHSTKVENTVTIVFSQKCKNSYQLGIVFKDGWNYWHQELITLD